MRVPTFGRATVRPFADKSRIASRTAVRDKLRAAYDHDTGQLIASSQVIAIHFQTVAAANDYWRG